MKRFVVAVAQWLVTLALVFVVWNWVVAPHLNQAIVVAPEPALRQVVTWARSGQLGPMVAVTLEDTIIGLAGGGVLGVALAVLTVVAVSALRDILEPAVAAVYAMPKFALVPIMLIWLGSGTMPRVIFVGIAVFPIIFVNVVSGFRTVGSERVEMMLRFGATKWQLATKLYLRHAMGYLIAAATFATAIALMTAVGAEMLFGTPQGLGGELSTAAANFDAAGAIGAILVATALSGALVMAWSPVTRRSNWRIR